MCRICKEKKLVTTYEEKTGICLECQDEIAQSEAEILYKRKFPLEKLHLSKVRGCLTGNLNSAF